MKTRRVNTREDGDPVIVEPSEEDEILLRIGARQRGEARIAILSNSQALRVASNLIRAVDEQLPEAR